MPARKRRQYSIGLSLASLVVACVLPVWVVAGFLVYHNYQSKRSLTELRMLETARALTMVVDRELTSMQAGLSVLATSPSLASGDLTVFRNRAAVALKAYPGADIILADATGQQLINTYLPVGAILPMRAVPETVRKVYATENPVISDVFKGAVTGRNRIAVEVPVFRDGRVVYDLAMTVPIDHFTAILLQQHLPAGWGGSILDGRQVLIARTRLSEQLAGQKAVPWLRERLRDTGEGSAEGANAEGVPIFDSFSRSATYGWTVAIGVPKAIMMAEIWRWLWLTIVGAALLSLTGVALALLLASQIASSIRGLIGPALALGQGNGVTIGHFWLREMNEVASSLVDASHLVQQRAALIRLHAAESERAESASRETEELKRFNAKLERREAEARALATQLAAVMDAVPAAMLFAHDPECRRITSNRTGYDLLRIPAGTNISLSARDDQGPSHYRLLRDGRELAPEELPVQLAAASGRETRDCEYTIQSSTTVARGRCSATPCRSLHEERQRPGRGKRVH